MRRPLVAVTGATGFIGGRLVPALSSKDFRVRALVRRPEGYTVQGVEKREADLLQPETLTPALRGVDVAFYLVHSMMAGSAFAERDCRGDRRRRDDGDALSATRFPPRSKWDHIS